MISIIIPTYNERKNIILLLKNIQAILSKNNNSFEVIIVDDNSSDGTGAAIKKEFQKKANIRLFVRKNERGLATALLSGINKTKGNIIVGLDADFNHPPQLIPKLVESLKNSDLVIASRFIKGGGMEEKTRYFFTYIFNFFLKNALGFPTMDNMSGFYSIKKVQLLKLPIEKIYQGYGEYHLRLVYLAKKFGLRIKETPVYYKKRGFGQSKSNLFKLFFKYLRVALFLKLKDGKI